MQYWDSKGRLHDTEATNKVNFFQNLANQAQAGLDNFGSWINNTNPNSEAYRQKADVLASLITLPIGGGVSTWGTKAIANGLKPYVGRKIAQATTEGLTGGTAAGLVAGALDSGLKNENPLTGALKGGVVGGLSGLAGGYGLSKIGQQFAKKGVAKSTQQANQYFNDYIDGLTNKTKPMAEYRGLKQGINKGTMQDLLDQIGWHGSPFDFDKFSNKFIGTGEGAQVHGLGHYIALDKDIANNRYKNRLGRNKIVQELQDLNNEDLFDSDINNLNISADTKEILNALKNDDWLGFDSPYEAINTLYSKDFQNFDPSEALIKAKQNAGTLYKTSIPDDDVFLREDLPFDQQPEKVQKGLREIANYLNNENLNNDIANNVSGRKLYTQVGVSIPDENFKNLLAKARATGDWSLLDKSIQENPKKASQLLNNYGIKGISYDGGIDGEARVIFNPDDIKILEKNGVPVEQPIQWSGSFNDVLYNGLPIKETPLYKLKYRGILDSLLREGKPSALNTLNDVKAQAEKNLQGDSLYLKKNANNFLNKYDSLVQEINDIDESNFKFLEPKPKQVVQEVIEELPIENTEIKENIYNPEIDDIARNYFGITNNRREAGYILNDGSLLDLSGKKMGGRAGTRGLDHREISDAFLDNPQNTNNLEIGFDEFIDNGAIRYLPESDSFFLAKKPSEQQIQAIKNLLNYTNGKGNFELVPKVSDWGKDNNFRKNYNLWSNPNKIIEDINTYYNGGTISPFRDYT